MASKSTLFSIRAPLPKQTAFVLGLVAPALVLGAWCVLTYGGLRSPRIFCRTPTEVVRGTLQLFIHYDLTQRFSSRHVASRSLFCLRLPLRCRSEF